MNFRCQQIGFEYFVENLNVVDSLEILGTG